MKLRCRTCGAELGEWDGAVRLRLEPTCTHVAGQSSRYADDEEGVVNLLHRAVASVATSPELVQEEIDACLWQIDHVRARAAHLKPQLLERQLAELEQRLDAARALNEWLRGLP